MAFGCFVFLFFVFAQFIGEKYLKRHDIHFLFQRLKHMCIRHMSNLKMIQPYLFNWGFGLSAVDRLIKRFGVDDAPDCQFR